MKAYTVTLTYKLFAESEEEAQLQALRSPCSNLTEIECDNFPLEEERKQIKFHVPDEEIPF